MAKNMQRSAWARAVSIAAVAFGLLTLKEGGAVLFIDGAARAAAGAWQAQRSPARRSGRVPRYQRAVSGHTVSFAGGRA